MDDDLAMVLPQPPPPNTARREAAIGAALRRFDGDAPVASGGVVQRGSWHAWLRRPQAAGLVTAGLAVLIAAPLAWLSTDRRSPPDTTTRADVIATPGVPVFEPALPQSVDEPLAEDTATVMAADAAPDMPDDDRIGATAAPSAPAPATAFATDDAASAPSEPPEVSRRFAPAERNAELSAPPFVMAAPAPPAPQAESTEGLIAQSGSAAGTNDRVATSVVVANARRARRAPDRRGDWNACTVNDPERSLAGCRAVVDPGAAGPGGRAAAHIADGLALAWQGNLDTAIARFDRAIEIAPRSAFAYLNRGLAYQRKGDLDRAIGDLDSAIRYAPDARAYYTRSLLFRARGDVERARRDEERAAKLDSEYGQLN